MWTDLVKIFRSSQPMESIAGEFMRMLQITREMAGLVSPHVFDEPLPLDKRRKIYELDIEVNKLERSIRKHIGTHLTLQRGDVSHCLVLFSLVKDVERIGDYIKNVSEVGELGGGRIPEGPLLAELRDIVTGVMETFDTVADVVSKEDHERAKELILKGRNTGKRCDTLLVELSKSTFGPAETTSMVLLTRFHKRIGGHLINVLSSLVMPLHKIDFFDEDDAR